MSHLDLSLFLLFELKLRAAFVLAGLGNQAERSDKGRAALSRFLESQRCSESFVEQV
jgi:hypothetical protein